MSGNDYSQSEVQAQLQHLVENAGWERVLFSMAKLAESKLSIEQLSTIERNVANQWKERRP